MSHGAAAVVAATAWLWLGMVLAISFLEAPLKFRAPGVDLPIGLGIGRLVFRALNAVECLFAVVVALAVLLGGPTSGVTLAAVAAIVVLGVQLVGVRPALGRRSDAVLAGLTGPETPRSTAHWWYVGLELLKVAALIALGTAALS
ncbi:hypothetical protein [Nocardioides sp.]|uniref:hypothetical protein n=1 Tax=Nocardioides sp. TaxID=35761 RepID=UPI002634B712|nr:hypothetical protein [Nocardioides sp.]